MNIDKIRDFTKPWIHPKTGVERLYLVREQVCEFINLELEYYKSGNIKHAVLDGEEISNHEAYRILNSMWKAYYDTSKRDWYSHTGDYRAINLILKKLDADQDEDQNDEQEGMSL